MAFYCATGGTCPICHLPRAALFARLANFTRPASRACTAFCRKHLLLTPSRGDLSHCVHRLSGNRILGKTVTCRAKVSGLSSSCRFVLVTSFSRLFRRTTGRVRFIPSFFLHGSRFFHGFVLFTRFAYTSKIMCPGVILQCGSRWGPFKGLV